MASREGFPWKCGPQLGIKSCFHTCLYFLLRDDSLLWMWSRQGAVSLPRKTRVKQDAERCVHTLAAWAPSPLSEPHGVLRPHSVEGP